MTTYSLLCCADTHDKTPPNLPEAGATAWLHAGDVCSGENQEALRRGKLHAADLDEWARGRRQAIGDWIAARTIPVFGVRGNHDVVDPWGFFESARM